VAQHLIAERRPNVLIAKTRGLFPTAGFVGVLTD
jgi:hypothetical protein